MENTCIISERIEEISRDKEELRRLENDLETINERRNEVLTALGRQPIKAITRSYDSDYLDNPEVVDSVEKREVASKTEVLELISLLDLQLCETVVAQKSRYVDMEFSPGFEAITKYELTKTGFGYLFEERHSGGGSSCNVYVFSDVAKKPLFSANTHVGSIDQQNPDLKDFRVSCWESIQHRLKDAVDKITLDRLASQAMLYLKDRDFVLGRYDDRASKILSVLDNHNGQWDLTAEYALPGRKLLLVRLEHRKNNKIVRRSVLDTVGGTARSSSYGSETSSQDGIQGFQLDLESFKTLLQLNDPKANLPDTGEKL